MSLCKGLVAEQIVTSKVVAELLEETEDIGDAVDCWEVESVLFPVKHGCGVKNKEGSCTVMCSAGWRSLAHACLRLGRLQKGSVRLLAHLSSACSFPCSRALIFASNSKGCVIIGVPGQACCTPGRWHDLTQPVQTPMNIMLSASSPG